jgi:hypothetical protein
VIVTAVSALTAAVAAEKAAVVAPAGTVTDAGTWATAVLLELRLTTAPPAGAGPSRVTVPVEELPPRTEVRDSPTEVRPAGVTVRVAVRLTLLKEAVIVTGVLAATGSVVAVKAAVVAPAATVTDAGTWAAAVLLELRETAKPPAGAGLSSVTVPVEGLPPWTEVGDRPTDVRPGGITVKVAVWLTLLKEAVIVTGVLVATGSVVVVKVVVVAPAATVTDAGTWAAAGLLELRETAKPPVGAGLESVTVPREDAPPTTEVGDRPRDVRTGAVTVRVAVRLTLLKAPVMVTGVLAATGSVVAVKVAVVAPAATVTDAGTWATDVSLELSVTTAPPVGAGPLSITVPVEAPPPKTEVGDRPTEERAAGVTVKVAVWLTLLKRAVIVTGVFEATGMVAAEKVAVVAPAATVTDAGTWAAAVLLELSETAKPPVGAGLASVTVPVEGLPPMTEVGDRPTDVSTGGVTVRVAVWLTLLKEAVIVTGVLAATGSVVAVKVAVVAPAATVTDAGTWAAAVLFELRLTTAPPVGAGPSRVTVPVEDTPPTTEVGDRPTEERPAGVTVKVAVLLTLLKVAVMVTGVFEATGSVVAVKVAVVAPAATVTDAGTWAAAVLLELRVTTAPPAGAGLSSVTVPVEGLPPWTEVGSNATDARTGGVTVKVAVLLTLLKEAVMVTGVLVATGSVVAVKVAVVVPAATVTDAGTWAAAVLFELRVTTAPPAGAGPSRVTVPVEDTPPATELGSRPIEVRLAGVTVRAAVWLALL